MNVTLPARETTSRRRRIDATTVRQVAALVAKQLTEIESCRLLNINPSNWRVWKSHHRHVEEFAALVEKLRAVRFNALLDRIDDASKGNDKRPGDWRASAHLLALGDPRRFSTNNPTTVETLPLAINVNVLAALTATAYPQETAKLPCSKLPELTLHACEDKT